MVSIMAYFCFRQHKRDPSRLPLPKSSHITPSYHPQSNSELFFLVGTLFTTCSHSYSQPRTSAARSPFTESITVIPPRSGHASGNFWRISAPSAVILIEMNETDLELL